MECSTKELRSCRSPSPPKVLRERFARCSIASSIRSFSHHHASLLHRTLKPAFDVTQPHSHHDRTAVRAGHRILGLHKLVDQPLHLLGSERHVHLDRGFASTLRRDRVAYALDSKAALL